MKSFKDFKKEKMEEGKTKLPESDQFSSLVIDDGEDNSPLAEAKGLPSFKDWKQEKEESVKQLSEYKDVPLDADIEEIYEELDEGIKNVFKGIKKGAVKVATGAVTTVDAVRKSTGAKVAGILTTGGIATSAIQNGSNFADAVVKGGYAGVGVASVVGLITHFIANRKRYEIHFRDAIGNTTRSAVQKLYFQAFQSMINKRQLDMTIKSSGTKIIIESKYALPKQKPSKIIIDVGFKQVSIFPENTGGSSSLDKYSFDGSSIKSVTGKAIGKGQGGRYLGREKIPNRALSYQQDIAKIFLIACDLMSEIYADYEQYFGDIARKIQASRDADANVFLAMESKYDLNSLYMQEKAIRNDDGSIG